MIERSDPERRGKGYALACGIDHLDSNPPDVVILVDADCRLTPGSIDALVQRAVETQRPVQGEYVFQPAESSVISMISALATLMRNPVRPRGLRRLGQPCHLTGTGMAFPWNVMRAAPQLGANIVEDLAWASSSPYSDTSPYSVLKLAREASFRQDGTQRSNNGGDGSTGTSAPFYNTVHD